MQYNAEREKGHGYSCFAQQNITPNAWSLDQEENKIKRRDGKHGQFGGEDKKKGKKASNTVQVGVSSNSREGDKIRETMAIIASQG